MTTRLIRSVIQLMNLKKASVLLVVMFFVINGLAQKKVCSEYEANQWAERENPEAKVAKAELEAFTKQFIQNSHKDETVYVIPVVFHILHNYGPENISKAQILDAMRILNEDFQKLNADSADVIPEFQGIAANCRIEFRLAKLDPNGNCTDGIVRTVTSETYSADDNSKLLSPSWNRAKYLNIWVVANIASGAAGYSFYPSGVSGPFGINIDGVMALNTYVGSIGTGTYSRSRTLTHEVGHYLNLPHPWGNSNQPGLASNCDIDDGIADTPNTIGHTSCDLYSVTCGDLDNVQNYMDYSYCDRMFTEGQKARMRAALNSTVSSRNNLWTTANLIATGTNDGYTVQQCIPISDFTFDETFGCNTATVQFNELVWNVDSGYTLQWSFPGASPSTSTDMNPIVSYSAPGLYSATLIASSSSGNNQITKSDIIQVLDPSLGEGLQWFESFENSSFPVNLSDANKNWLIWGNSASNWTRVTNAGYTGTSSLRVANASNSAGQTSELYSPNVIFAGNNPSSVFTFRVAYAQKTVDDNDKLQVYFSYNCGQSWYLRLTRTGSALATNGGSLVSSFTPNASQWRQESIAISTLFTTKPNFRVKFLLTSGDGNSTYLDDINIESLTNTDNLPLSVINNLSVYPNPISKESVLTFDLNQPSLVKISVTNILGQTLSAVENKYTTGLYDILLSNVITENLENGIYFLNVEINGKREVIKLIKQ